MPALLVSRLAYIALFAVFLIPVAGSSLRGLTHLLTCSEPVETPFEVILLPDSPPVVTGSAVLEADAEPTLCGGLIVDVSVGVTDDDRVEVAAEMTNRTASEWRGTVQLEVAGTRIPLDVGRIGPGETRREAVALRLPAGTTGLDGSVLLGP